MGSMRSLSMRVARISNASAEVIQNQPDQKRTNLETKLSNKFGLLAIMQTLPAAILKLSPDYQIFLLDG
jgi:hypothetical protein